LGPVLCGLVLYRPKHICNPSGPSWIGSPHSAHQRLTHHHFRLRPSTYEASVTRQSGSALCSCPTGFCPKRNMYSSSLRGALRFLPPRLRSLQCRVELCIVQSINAEESEGLSPWRMAVALRRPTSKEALCATMRTPTASAAATSAKNSASSGFAGTPLLASRCAEMPWALNAPRWIRSPGGRRHNRSYVTSVLPSAVARIQPRLSTLPEKPLVSVSRMRQWASVSAPCPQS
jgi:hypothetical protein